MVNGSVLPNSGTAVFLPPTVIFFPHFSVFGFDFSEELCYICSTNGCDEDPVAGKMPREEPFCCDGSAPLPLCHTTSEPPAGNSRTGAPVIAPMSGGGHTATRVEPWNTFCIPPLIFQGWDFFISCPNSKGGKNHVRRKSVHL